MTDLLHDPTVGLPDGRPADRWDLPPVHTRTYVVDQGSPAASDAGSGTEEQPFLTIGRAAAAVRPGERVLVRAGIYREHVRPVRGGDGPERMVTFEGAHGEDVVIRGSVVLAGPWQPSDAQDGGWVVRLPEADFTEHNPFLHENVEREDPSSYQSSVPTARSAADTLRRGLVFQDGRRLRQVAGPAHVAAEEGSFWVEDDGRTLHLRTFDGVDPGSVLMEATNRAQCVAPAGPGVSYVRVRGFVIEHAGNRFSYPVEAAVSPMGGHHWIIEDNVIRQVGSDGVGIGGHVWVWGGDAGSTAGHRCIVRRNTISDCGVSGVKGISVVGCIVEDNVIERIGWQDVELWYDNGGLKILVCTDTLVRHNLVRGVVGGPGMWLDWDDVNCRVTQNVVVDSTCPSGGIFLEACEQANWVDNNVLWNIEGFGFYQQDADGLTVFDNVIGGCSGAAIYMCVCTDRPLHGRQVTCKRNDVRGNVLVDNGATVYFSDPDNASDGNVVAGRSAANTLTALRTATGHDEHSVHIPFDVEVDTSTLEISWRLPAGAEDADLPSPLRLATAAGTTTRLFDRMHRVLAED